MVPREPTESSGGHYSRGKAKQSKLLEWKSPLCFLSFFFPFLGLQILSRYLFFSLFVLFALAEGCFQRSPYLHLPTSHICKQFSSLIRHMEKTQNSSFAWMNNNKQNKRNTRILYQRQFMKRSQRSETNTKNNPLNASATHTWGKSALWRYQK